MLDDDFVREYLALQAELKRRTEQYLTSEAMLSRVARSPLPGPFEVIERAAMEFANGEAIEGEAHIGWPDRRLKASFHRRLGGPREIPQPNPGIARIVPSGTSQWVIEQAHIDDAHVRAERNDADIVVSTIDDSLSARKFRRTFGNREPRFHRTIFRGGNLDGYPHEALCVYDR
jgi:hypothetical protein